MAQRPEEFRAVREQMLLRMVVRLYRSMNDETIRRMQLRGHDMQLTFTRFLGNLDTEGTRIGALARRMGTTRQAANQLLLEIERGGFVERRPDPEDKRGVIVCFTPRGRKALNDAVESMLEIEAEYASAIGASGYKKLKQLLFELVEKTDPQGGFGLD
jgi:DNA-binding MarR family transcriptional regulator